MSDFEAPGYVWRDGYTQIGVGREGLTIWNEHAGTIVASCDIPTRDVIEMASILTAIAEEAGLEVVQPIVLKDPEAERVNAVSDSIEALVGPGGVASNDGELLLGFLRERGFDVVRLEV